MKVNDWFSIKRQKDPQTKDPPQEEVVCKACKKKIKQAEFIKNLNVCSHCNYHHAISSRKRIEITFDPTSFTELWASEESKDPLNFTLKPYRETLLKAKEKTGLKDAVICGLGTIHRIKVVAAVMDFSFVGGSLGSLVGDKIAALGLVAHERNLPFVIFTTSGGARMQEGIISLFQMAKVNAVMALLDEAGLPVICVLTNPTTGGVSASFATIGDIIIAEPGALIGFTGRKIIEATINKKLPEDFQTAEFSLKSGHIDATISRQEIREYLVKILDYLAVR